MTRATDAAGNKDVALFLDFENLKRSLQEQKRQLNLTALMESVQEIGRIVVARAYADWQQRHHVESEDQFHLYEAGIEPVYVPGRRNDGKIRKNSADVKMSSDCMETSFTYPSIGTYVLISGDADFLHVANSLRSRGNRVVVIGASWSTSSRISERVDRVIYYDKEIDPEQILASTIPASASPELRRVLRTLVDLLREQRDLANPERYPVPFTWLASNLRARDAEFDVKALGFGKFKGLMLHAQEQGLLKVETHALADWALLPEDRRRTLPRARPSSAPPAAAPTTRPDQQAQPGPVVPAREGAGKATTPPPSKPSPSPMVLAAREEVGSLIVTLIRRRREAGAHACPGWLIMQVRKELPEFSYTDYGVRAFGELLQHGERAGHFRRVVQGARTWIVLPGDSPPDSG